MSIQYQWDIIDKTEGARTKLFIGFGDHNQKEYNKLLGKVHTKQMNALRLELALTGPNKDVLENPDHSYKFDKDGIRALEKLSEDLFEKEHEFEFHKTKFSDLSIVEKKVICNMKSETAGTEVTDTFLSWKINKESYDILSNFIYEHPEYPQENE